MTLTSLLVFVGALFVAAGIANMKLTFVPPKMAKPAKHHTQKHTK